MDRRVARALRNSPVRTEFQYLMVLRDVRDKKKVKIIIRTHLSSLRSLIENVLRFVCVKKDNMDIQGYRLLTNHANAALIAHIKIVQGLIIVLDFKAQEVYSSTRTLLCSTAWEAHTRLHPLTPPSQTAWDASTSGARRATTPRSVSSSPSSATGTKRRKQNSSSSESSEPPPSPPPGRRKMLLHSVPPDSSLPLSHLLSTPGTSGQAKRQMPQGEEVNLIDEAIKAMEKRMKRDGSCYVAGAAKITMVEDDGSSSICSTDLTYQRVFYSLTVQFGEKIKNPDEDNETTSTSDSSEQEDPKKLPFCMLHGLPDNRLNELFDIPFPSDDDLIEIFDKGVQEYIHKRGDKEAKQNASAETERSLPFGWEIHTVPQSSPNEGTPTTHRPLSPEGEGHQSIVVRHKRFHGKYRVVESISPILPQRDSDKSFVPVSLLSESDFPPEKNVAGTSKAINVHEDQVPVGTLPKPSSQVTVPPVYSQGLNIHQDSEGTAPKESTDQVTTEPAVYRHGLPFNIYHDSDGTKETTGQEATGPKESTDQVTTEPAVYRHGLPFNIYHDSDGTKETTGQEVTGPKESTDQVTTEPAVYRHGLPFNIYHDSDGTKETTGQEATEPLIHEAEPPAHRHVPTPFEPSGQTIDPPPQQYLETFESEVSSEESERSLPNLRTKKHKTMKQKTYVSGVVIKNRMDKTLFKGMHQADEVEQIEPVEPGADFYNLNVRVQEIQNVSSGDESDSDPDSSEENSTQTQREGQFKLLAGNLCARAMYFDQLQENPTLPVEQENQERNEDNVPLYNDERNSWSNVPALTKPAGSSKDPNSVGWVVANKENLVTMPNEDISIHDRTQQFQKGFRYRRPAVISKSVQLRWPNWPAMRHPDEPQIVPLPEIAGLEEQAQTTDVTVQPSAVSGSTTVQSTGTEKLAMVTPSTSSGLVRDPSTLPSTENPLLLRTILNDRKKIPVVNSITGEITMQLDPSVQTSVAVSSVGWLSSATSGPVSGISTLPTGETSTFPATPSVHGGSTLPRPQTITKDSDIPEGLEIAGAAPDVPGDHVPGASGQPVSITTALPTGETSSVPGPPVPEGQEFAGAAPDIPGDHVPGASGQPVSITTALPTGETSSVPGPPVPEGQEFAGAAPDIPGDHVPVGDLAVPERPINEVQEAVQGILPIPPLVQNQADPGEFQFLVPGPVLRPRRPRRVVVRDLDDVDWKPPRRPRRRRGPRAPRVLPAIPELPDDPPIPLEIDPIAPEMARQIDEVEAMEMNFTVPVDEGDAHVFMELTDAVGQGPTEEEDLKYCSEEGVQIVIQEKAREIESNVLRFSDCCKPHECSRRYAGSFFNGLLGLSEKKIVELHQTEPTGDPTQIFIKGLNITIYEFDESF